MPDVVAFEGCQTIANVDEAHARLRIALATGEPVEIDLSAIVEADLAFVQLLVAARKAVAAQGGALAWRGPFAAVTKVISCAGLVTANLLQAPKGDKP
jgi:hypothetical protein